jgi:hypothetical protein
MKKMNYFLASASLLLFLFLGVQGLQAQTSIAPSPVNVKSYTQALQGVNLVAEDAAINVLTNEAKNLYQNMPSFNTAEEIEAGTKIDYYQYLVDQLDQGAVLGELLPQSASHISAILARYQSPPVTVMNVYQDTLELLQQ